MSLDWANATLKYYYKLITILEYDLDGGSNKNDEREKYENKEVVNKNKNKNF